MNTTKSKFRSFLSRSMLCVALLAATAMTPGCVSNPSKAHIVKIDAVGTKLGVTQNPTSGVYELGIQRIHTEVITIPVYAVTNANGTITMVVPDSVARYEANTHSAVFGNAAITSSMATGTNAVNTAVGGSTPPINASTGTGNNLVPTSH